VNARSSSVRFVAVAWGLAGCTASGVRSRGPGNLPPDLDARYTFELVRAAETFVRVRVEARGTREGETTFAIQEHWGGVEHFEEGIRAVEVRDRAGRALSVERPASNRWSVRHAPSEAIEASYEIAPTGTEVEDSREGRYRPVLVPSLFHLIGETGLLWPEHLEGDEPRAIEVCWRGFEEAGWKVISSFGAEPTRFRVSRSLPDFRHALFLAGDLRLHRVPLPGGTLDVAIAGTDWEFTDAAFVEMATKIVESGRDFFDDHRYPTFRISLIPVGKKDPRSHSLGGTGLVDSFALFLRPSTRLELEPGGGRGLRGLLAHELFHHWNGQRIERVEPEPLVYWFSEGFTDFYARRLLLRSGLLTPEEYAADLNESVAGYFTSPVRNEPNERILADFWRNGDVEKLPYRRGDVVAVLTDAAIRKASGGARSLDDFMRDLLERATSGGEKVSTESLVEGIGRATSTEFAERIRRIVVDGETATIEADVLEPCLEGRVETVAAFEPGFDVEASVKAKVATGVVEGSEAHRAGLRNDQALKGWSISHGRTDLPIELTVVDSGAERRLSFFPRGKPVPVPRFRVRPGAGEECRARL
jgi:predicted metalloprotease with PDZ domain